MVLSISENDPVDSWDNEEDSVATPDDDDEVDDVLGSEDLPKI